MICVQSLAVKDSWTQAGNVMIVDLMLFIMHQTNSLEPLMEESKIKATKT